MNERTFKHKIELIKNAIAAGRIKDGAKALREARAEFEKWSNEN